MKEARSFNRLPVIIPITVYTFYRITLPVVERHGDPPGHQGLVMVPEQVPARPHIHTSLLAVLTTGRVASDSLGLCRQGRPSTWQLMSCSLLTLQPLFGDFEALQPLLLLGLLGLHPVSVCRAAQRFPASESAQLPGV